MPFTLMLPPTLPPMLLRLFGRLARPLLLWLWLILFLRGSGGGCARKEVMLGVVVCMNKDRYQGK